MVFETETTEIDVQEIDWIDDNHMKTEEKTIRVTYTYIRLFGREWRIRRSFDA